MNATINPELLKKYPQIQTVWDFHYPRCAYLVIIKFSKFNITTGNESFEISIPFNGPNPKKCRKEALDYYEKTISWIDPCKLFLTPAQKNMLIEGIHTLVDIQFCFDVFDVSMDLTDSVTRFHPVGTDELCKEHKVIEDYYLEVIDYNLK